MSSSGSMEDFEARKGLIAMVTGGEPADTVILNGFLVNVLTGEVLTKDIAVKSGRIAAVGDDIDQYVGTSTRTIDAEGLYITPGFIDAHLHIESSLLSPSRFAELMASKGVTTVFYDPHEIANVLGLEGVRWMYDELEKTPLNGFLTVPSCVPASSPDLETTGAEFGIKEIDQALGWENTAALGEMMNFPGVLRRHEETMEKIKRAFEHGLPVEGHASGLSGAELDGYGSAGIESDHEAVTKEDGIERGRKGFWTYIREGSGWADVGEVVRALTETEISSRRYCLVTDDRDATDLIDEGGVDHVIRRAIEEGLDPVEAITMATLNPATRFGMDAKLGSISPGRRADINLVSDLGSLEVEETILAGEPVEDINWPVTTASALTDTVRFKGEITPEIFKIRENERKSGIKVRDQDITTEKIELSGVEESRLDKCAVIERHKGTGNVGRSFVEGFNLESGAIASTVAHDSHNLIVLGESSVDMSVAASYLVDVGGGQVVVEGSEVKAAVELPVAGLMSDLDPDEVATSLIELKETVSELGCELSQPFMILSSLALAVIPEVRLTDKGLVDVEAQEFIH